MGNRCRLWTVICHASSKWCGYPGLRAHNPLTSPITQRSRRTYNCGVKQPPHWNLRFANVKREDEKKEYEQYLCIASNFFLRRNAFGPRHIIRPQGSTPLSFKPDYMWSSPSETLGMRGEMLKLKCIFSGNPTPTVSWSLPIPDDASRVMYSTGGQEISIDDIQESDEGVYTCTGSSFIEGESYSQSRSINVRIESEPRFIIRPNNVFSESGDSVSFLCKAEGKPVPTIEWFVNGVNLQDTTQPIIHSDRFLHPDAYNMTFVDVRKEESMCIQCNASNKHGYVFADVFLSVDPQE
ncbi:hypothetical protein FSP39_014373 [Pinctada imbricata]|uniref:Ig-like domain-containing protein n=1 Tax=Pinctada imbricata TaxID=66713 RepID=A0AA89CE10_PINIB|nr:hypothetical protein FSP39_014373 [Pinctada imbricata]